MRLGGPIPGRFDDPGEWLAALAAAGYTAAYCPLSAEASDAEAAAFVAAAKRAGVVIAEVGAWSNPASPVESVRRESLAFCKRQLALAERVGARCCVNISGSRGPQDAGRLTAAGWDSPHAENLTPAAFDAIVQTVREILDEVRPTRTFYTLETMPWMYPDSADSYVELLRAIDRKGFAVHLDPVNLVCSPQRYFANAALIRECFAKLGPHIRSCHAKDILLDAKLTVHLSEARPGAGGLDYRTFLSEAAKLDADLPVMLEHLPDPEQYRLAAEHVRAVAKQSGLSFTPARPA